MAENQGHRRQLDDSDGSVGFRSVRVLLRIRDQVCPMGKSNKVFEPFFTTKPDGMGMGLSISRTIIEAHGGRMAVSANPDRGVTFHFTLPTEAGS